jgi:hypothetical protein
MNAACLVYLLSLSAILALGVRGSYRCLRTQLVAIFLLVWADLVLTAQLLSLFSALHLFGVYVSTSLAIAVLLTLGARCLPIGRELDLPQFADPFPPGLSRYLFSFFIVTLALVFLADVVLAYGLLPSNPDSLTYRFPRAYWYLGHGALTHFSNVADPRTLYYPFNGSLLYAPLVYFGVLPQAFTFVSLLCWLVIALATYLFARDLGGPRVTAAATAWLICLTPNVLLQALSTNDEIIAASAMLAALFFLHRWYRGREPLDALIGIAGVALSAGTKLHVTFYWPLLITIGVVLAVQFRATAAEVGSWLTARRLSALSITLCLSLVMAFSFMIYNKVSAGRVTAWDFHDQVLNKPFQWRVAVQTLVLYLSQVVLTPFADLHVVFSPASRVLHYEGFNRLFAPLFAWVNNGPAYMSASYRFTGINSGSAVAFNEQTLFIGFTWLVALISGVLLLSRRKGQRVDWPAIHLLSFPVWMATYAASMRYIEGFTVYLGYAVIVAAPAMVFAFAPIRHLLADRLRWGLLAFVAVVHCFFAADIFLTSSPRNLIALLRAPHWPVARGFAVDDEVVREISASTAGIYNRSISWEQPFWLTMFQNPEIPQYLATNPDPIPVSADAPTDPASLQLRYSRYVLMPRPGDRHLHLFLFPQAPKYGQMIPVHIPDKTSPGLTWIGDIGFTLGPEWVFGAGNEVESRHAGRDKYVLVPYQELAGGADGQGRLIRIPPIVYGLAEADRLQFRFELKVSGKIIAASDWLQVPSADLVLPKGAGDNAVLTAFVRKDDAAGAIYSTDVEIDSTQPVLLGSSRK